MTESGPGEVLARERRHLAPTLAAAYPIVWDRAAGSRVWSVDGQELVDFTSGVLIANVGHAHPVVTAAIVAQAARGLTTYAVPHAGRGAYAQQLLEQVGAPFDALAMLTTGSEAVDLALRLARAATGAGTVVTFGDSFHGKTSATAAMSGLPWNRPLEPNDHRDVVVVPFPDTYRVPAGIDPAAPAESAVALLRELVRIGARDRVAAIVVEPYLGAGGGVPCPPGFLALLRAAADDLGALLVVDEVQSGFGRTGPLFAYQGEGVRPDLVVIGKGMASGVPMAGLLGTHDLFSVLPPGALWNSYAGNPLSCAAASATLDVLLTPGLGERVSALGQRLRDTLTGWDLPHLGRVPGSGLSLGLDVVTDRASRTPDPERARALVQAACRAGVIVLPPGGRGANVVRLAPPLTISDDELVDGLAALHTAATSVLA